MEIIYIRPLVKSGEDDGHGTDLVMVESELDNVIGGLVEKEEGENGDDISQVECHRFHWVIFTFRLVKRRGLEDHRRVHCVSLLTSGMLPGVPGNTRE